MKISEISITKVLLAVLILIILGSLFTGCTEKSKCAHFCTMTKPRNLSLEINEENPFILGETFNFQGATIAFKKAEFREKIPVFLGETSYSPKNGKYLVVYFSFKGSKENESAGVNTDIFLLKDSQGRSYQMSSYTSNHEANDLAMEEGMEVAGMLLWSQEEEEDSLLVYDIPSDSSGLTMNIIYQEGEELKTFAIIDLGL